MYQHFLNTSDVAVQLRTTSRGETSRAILDCMSAALPVIITEIGSSAEYPDQVAIKVPASTTSDDLATALVHLHANPELRREMGARAREYVRSTHHPALVGRAFAEAIELFYRESNRSIEQELLDTMSGTKPSHISTDLDVRRLAESISRDLPFPSFAQILYDVTAIAETDLRTGVERVVRGLLNALIEQPPDGYRIEPVLIRDGVVTYARRFTEERLELPLGGLEDSPVEFGPADHYVVVGWIPDQLSTIEPWLGSFRRAGGTVTMVVHDLLPLEFPQFFPDWIPRVTTNWLQCVLRTADKVACVSATVAKDVAGHVQAFEVKRTTPLIIKHFPLGSDLQASSPSSGVSVEAQHALSECAHRHTFLMVGTVEPRKGHDQVLKAFEILWDEGQDIGLILVGKEGWMVEHVVARIRENQRKGSKLIWLQSASDEVLHELYDAACALLAASLGEGFGLPIIEAASHNLPIIARDIPVFCEVAGDHAFYFDGLDAGHLAQRLRAWLALYEQNLAPHSLFIKRFDWRTSTERFTDIMIDGHRPSRVDGRKPSLLAFAD
jgi:glycosyltransferase involved in cell wall biosynthesis